MSPTERTWPWRRRIHLPEPSHPIPFSAHRSPSPRPTATLTDDAGLVIQRDDGMPYGDSAADPAPFYARGKNQLNTLEG